METATVYDDRLVIETPEAVAFNLELAGIGSRGVALLIDQLILGLVITVEITVLVLIASFAGGLFSENVDDAVVYGTIALGVVLWFVTSYGYHLFYEVRRNGRTPGKRIAGIRVARQDGGRVTFGTSAVRNLLRIIDTLPSAYLVGILAVLFSRQRQRVGDMAAGTVVVYEPKERPLELGDALVSGKTELAHDFLKRRASLAPAARDMVAREVLLALGEEAGEGWDEPVIAGRIADLVGARERFAAPVTPPAAPPAGQRADEDVDEFFTGTA